MFLWIKLLGIEDTVDLIMKKARDKGVLFVPGSVFYPESDKKSPHIRASYSLCTPEEMDKVGVNLFVHNQTSFNLF